MGIKTGKYEIYVPILDFLAYFCDVTNYVTYHLMQLVMSLINNF